MNAAITMKRDSVSIEYSILKRMREVFDLKAVAEAAKKNLYKRQKRCNERQAVEETQLLIDEYYEVVAVENVPLVLAPAVLAPTADVIVDLNKDDDSVEEPTDMLTTPLTSLTSNLVN